MVLEKYVPWVPKDPNTHRVFGALQPLAILRQRNLFGMVSLRHPVKKGDLGNLQHCRDTSGSVLRAATVQTLSLLHAIPFSCVACDAMMP